jgi:hypothetical protein
MLGHDRQVISDTTHLVADTMVSNGLPVTVEADGVSAADSLGWSFSGRGHLVHPKNPSWYK